MSLFPLFLTNLTLEHPGVRQLAGLETEAPGVVPLTVGGREPENTLIFNWEVGLIKFFCHFSRI